MADTIHFALDATSPEAASGIMDSGRFKTLGLDNEHPEVLLGAVSLNTMNDRFARLKTVADDEGLRPLQRANQQPVNIGALAIDQAWYEGDSSLGQQVEDRILAHAEEQGWADLLIKDEGGKVVGFSAPELKELYSQLKSGEVQIAGIAERRTKVIGDYLERNPVSGLSRAQQRRNNSALSRLGSPMRQRRAERRAQRRRRTS